MGDLIWQAADARARGFLMGGTAGRTTLAGEGLQHQDGHSLILASTNPAVVSYDPAFAYEIAVIVEHGLHRMCIDEDDVIFYITIYNENYAQPPMPDGAREGIVDGMYRFAGVPDGVAHRATILFSGPSHSAARWARHELAERYGVGAELWSVTSYGRLRDDAIAVERWNRLHPDRAPRTPLVTERLGTVDGPVVAVTDYMRAVPDQVSRWIPGPYTSLGTDGFGRSDARDELRRFYEVNGPNVVVAVLSQTGRGGRGRSGNGGGGDRPLRRRPGRGRALARRLLETASRHEPEKCWSGMTARVMRCSCWPMRPDSARSSGVRSSRAFGTKVFTAAALAWDVRGHGRGPALDLPASWWTFGRDLVETDRQHGQCAGRLPDSVVGVGHSMGGTVLVLAELLRPGTFTGLVLVEPVLIPPPFVRNPELSLAQGAARRRPVFGSRDELVESVPGQAVVPALAPGGVPGLRGPRLP